MEFERTDVAWQGRLLLQHLGETWESLWAGNPTLPSWPDVDLDPLWWRGLLWLLLTTLAVGLVLGLRHARWRRPTFRIPRRPAGRRGSPSVQNELAQAQALAHQGAYGEAARCLYRALLQDLHDQSLIAHSPGRPDGEYQRLLQDLPLAAGCEVLILTHEQWRFAGRPVSAEGYQDCLWAYERFCQRLQDAS
ncbi:MAG: DUF4129 domain-containing protein [Gloeomargaritaceae cyanobacterium C42_A2020_066]|nr:DUF4129 domain-containing protein [Gloeomargaritaceae cyanobacterium C42_A2020_066]